MSAGADGATTTLLLPARRRIAGTPAPRTARLLGRADRLADGTPGEQAQLARHVELLPRGWPLAAITRALDADDAPLHAWLRADPTHVRPDMTGARVLAIGALGRQDAATAANRTLRAGPAQVMLTPAGGIQDLLSSLLHVSVGQFGHSNLSHRCIRCIVNFVTLNTI